MNPAVQAVDVTDAHRRIAGLVQTTPLVCSQSLSALLNHDVRLKLESVQETGSFKLRGAFNRLLTLSVEEKSRGVVTLSTGNHGRAVAFAGKKLGIRTVVCLTSLVPANKVEAIRALGAEVHIAGADQDIVEAEVDRLAAREGLVVVSPFDDPEIIAGQGTIGLELLAQQPDLSAVIVPLSGGGLISGIALAMKAVRPEMRVIGVTMDNGPAMVLSQQAGQPVSVEELPSLADSLTGGIGLANKHTFGLVRDLVDEMVLVSEAEIADGLRHAYEQERLIIEGGAAVGIAALLARRITLPAGPVAVILSGRNVNIPMLTKLLHGEDGSADGGVVA
ncbi:MAG: hydroxyectoine utilization dehydratase EutB [Alphaproteobacteria bacterium]